MDFNSKSITEVTFSPKRNGYDPTGVDDFIDEVAEGVRQLEVKLREAQERASSAEARANEAASSSTGAPSNAMSATDIGKIWERAAAGAEATMEEARQEAAHILDEARNNAAIAEAAVDEAHADAARIRQEAEDQVRQQHEESLQSARAEADNILRNARNEAEGLRSQAQSDADSTLSGARQEAARIAESSQGQIREEVSKLESARDELRQQVTQLNEHATAELGRVRETLNNALEVVNSSKVGSFDVPQTPPVEIPEARYAQGADYDSGSYSPHDAPDASYDSNAHGAAEERFVGYDNEGGAPVGHHDGGQWQQQNEWSQTDTDSQHNDSHQGDKWASEDAHVDRDNEVAYGDRQSGAAQDDSHLYGAHGNFGSNDFGRNDDEEPSAWEVMQRNDEQRNAHQSDDSHVAPWERNDNSFANLRDEDDSDRNRAHDEPAHDETKDDNYDPFLAELRRAVHDDSGLGPMQGDDNSIDNLYSDKGEDDDSSKGFFRRRK